MHVLLQESFGTSGGASPLPGSEMEEAEVLKALAEPHEASQIDAVGISPAAGPGRALAPAPVT